MNKIIVTGLFLVAAMFFSLNCGKKGPLYLEPELIPPSISTLNASQVGTNVKLIWEFPQLFLDKKKTKLDVNLIDRINIYYSGKEIPGNKFQKKSSLTQKLKMGDLTEITDTPEKTLPQNPGSARVKVSENTSYCVLVPFKLKDLDMKNHFFGITYSYKKKSSSLSPIAFIQTIIPVKPVTGLTINRENKVIKLTWTKPLLDETNKSVATIAGYNIFKKIDSGEKEKQTEVTKIKIKPLSGFKKINKDSVLIEYFEDWDSGETGTYSYYVSTMVSSQVESERSDVVSVEFTDIYPPDPPANLVSFKSTDSIFLTWQEVKDLDLSHYRVYRKTSEKDEYKILTDKITAVNYKDKDIQKGVTYFYVVTSVDRKGNESPLSNEVKEQF